MPAPPSRKHALSPEHRSALTLLAGSATGHPESLMLSNGFTVPLLRDLVRRGLATVARTKPGAGGKGIIVALLRITDAGRRALAG
jgi:hypothetical protein